MLAWRNILTHNFFTSFAVNETSLQEPLVDAGSNKFKHHYFKVFPSAIQDFSVSPFLVVEWGTFPLVSVVMVWVKIGELGSLHWLELAD